MGLFACYLVTWAILLVQVAVALALLRAKPEPVRLTLAGPTQDGERDEKIERAIARVLELLDQSPTRSAGRRAVQRKVRLYGDAFAELELAFLKLPNASVDRDGRVWRLEDPSLSYSA